MTKNILSLIIMAAFFAACQESSPTQKAPELSDYLVDTSSPKAEKTCAEDKDCDGGFVCEVATKLCVPKPESGEPGAGSGAGGGTVGSGSGGSQGGVTSGGTVGGGGGVTDGGIGGSGPGRIADISYNIIAGTDTGAYVSSDDGETWEKLSIGAGPIAVNSITFDGDYFNAATSAGYYRSGVGNFKDWPATQVKLAGKNIKLIFRDLSGALYISTPDKLYIIGNRGGTETPLAQVTGQVMAILPCSDMLYAVSDQGIFRFDHQKWVTLDQVKTGVNSMMCFNKQIFYGMPEGLFQGTAIKKLDYNIREILSHRENVNGTELTNIYLGGGSGICLLNKDGDPWTCAAITGGPSNVNDMYRNKGLLFVAADDGVYRHRLVDGSWKQILQGKGKVNSVLIVNK